MKKLFLGFLYCYLSSNLLHAQITTIPDTSFEAKLIQLGIDSDGQVNGQILDSDAVVVTSLDVQNSQISNITGIESFVNLDTFICAGNQIDTLDFSSNTALTFLDISGCHTYYLDLTNNTGLIYFNASNNFYLTDIDLSNNIAIETLGLGSFLALTSLDLSNNVNLKTLGLANANVSHLDLSNNTALKDLNTYNSPNIQTLNIANCVNLRHLGCYKNSLNQLDVSSFPLLESLYCGSTNISTLDISNNPNLEILSCAGNNLTSLDFSNNPDLYYIVCGSNQISYLDLTVCPLLTIFSATNSPHFLKLCVTDIPSVIGNSNWYLDPTTTLIEQCRYSLAIYGDIAVDANTNCQVDSQENAVSSVFLIFDNGVDSTYAVSNINGKYFGHLDTGSYTVTVVSPHPYLIPCQNSFQVNVDTSYTMQNIDIALQTIASCPYLEIDIDNPRLIRCFDSDYTIQYCNSGTTPVSNTIVEVELDSNLYYNSSSIPLVSQNGNVYQFNTGGLAIGQCGEFKINVTASCASILGQIHCATAHIYPDSLCLSSLTNLHIEDTCLGDTVVFVVSNYADDFPVGLPYFLLADTMVVDAGMINLTMGQSMILRYPTSGSSLMYQLVIADDNPKYYTASRLVGCSPNAQSTQLLYIPHVQQEFMAIDCQSNRGSYDPNEKTAFPLGYTNNNYIAPNTPLEYQIHFQNTGTDTAYFINIYDTLSPHLDPATIQIGTASHSYTWNLVPPSPGKLAILHFEFNPINLPDSFVNVETSQGFITYTIQQRPNLPNGTTINNRAAIYFDYNAPIITNTTTHTICDNCLPTNIIDFTNLMTIPTQLYEVVVFPNPFEQSTQIRLDGYKENKQDLTLELYDVMGRLYLLKIGVDNEQCFTLGREELATGIYLFRIVHQGSLIATGRVIAK